MCFEQKKKKMDHDDFFSSGGLGKEERTTLFGSRQTHEQIVDQQAQFTAKEFNTENKHKCVNAVEEQVDSGFQSEILLQTSSDCLDKKLQNLSVKTEEEEEKEFLRINKSLSDVDTDGDTLFHTLAIQQHKEAATYYTDYLMDSSPLDIQNNQGLTPLMLATISGQKELVRLFVKFGASLDIRDKQGYTTLHYASEKGHADCALMLVHPLTTDEIAEVCYDVTAFRAHKGLLTWKTNNGQTCLELAVQNRQFNMLMFLCVYLKDDVNAREGTRGNTPLHTAVEREDFVMTQFLVHEFKHKRCRLNIDAKRFDGWTAYQLAFNRKTETSQKIAAYLAKWGASAANFETDSESDSSMDEPCIEDHDNPMEFEDM